MARAGARGELDRFEQEELAFFERVRSTYLRLAEESSGRYRVLDASLRLDEVQAELARVCRDLVACWGVRHPES